MLRYAFRSVEKVQLQEIGPRFTLKLRSLKKGLPAVKNLGEVSKPLEFDTFEDDNEEEAAKEEAAKAESTTADNEDQPMEEDGEAEQPMPAPKAVVPPKEDEYQWVWKVRNSPVRSCMGRLRFSTARVGDNKANLLPVDCITSYTFVVRVTGAMYYWLCYMRRCHGCSMFSRTFFPY